MMPNCLAVCQTKTRTRKQRERHIIERIKMGSLASPHVILFPFMSKGHTIPILQLAGLLLKRGATVTIFTTSANRPFISDSLSDTNAAIIDLPFPQNIDGIPAGVESTDKLPSMSLFVPFANATKLMKPYFEKELENLPDVTFMVTDGFLGWTLNSASTFGIPRLAYYGMGMYASSLSQSICKNRLLFRKVSDDELFPVTDFPWIKLTKNDFEPVFTMAEPKGPHFEFLIEQVTATEKSHGLLVNTFYELEQVYVDYWNRECSPMSWCIGPLCLAEPMKVRYHNNYKKPLYIQWLDQKLAEEKPVLYVAFGSQAEVSSKQFKEIKTGLEKSEVSFLWVLRRNQSDLGDDPFEEKVKERGLVVRDWVDQREILEHQIVQGFVSHCGWNSVMESICAKVPILAWPMMAEQHLNARMVVEEIKIGLRVETCDGSVRGFVKWEGLEKMVRELMVGETGKEVRKKVKEIGEAAIKALDECGSSSQTLNELIHELSFNKTCELK